MPAYFKKKGKGSYHAHQSPGTKPVLKHMKKKRSKPGVGKPYMGSKA